jgi:hypothetical protein
LQEQRAPQSEAAADHRSADRLTGGKGRSAATFIILNGKQVAGE